MSTKQDKKFELTATTLFGLEQVLGKEIEKIGGENIQQAHRAVTFTGDKELLYKANYHLRTAIRVLKPIHQTKVKNDIQLYNSIKSIEWDKLMDAKQTFLIDSNVTSPHFNHSHYVSQKVKDAIVDLFKGKYGKRPSVDTNDPDIKINVLISNEDMIVSLDSSGESLHKRGYRSVQGPAPLNEILAAGMILLTEWEGNSNFVDPMCGSGTLAIEAALIAYNIPPGTYRKKFGFENWLDYDDDLFQRIVDETSEKKDVDHFISASDISHQATSIAKQNIKSAMLEKKIELATKSIEDLVVPNGGGLAVINPPYGERLKEYQIKAFYSRIGDALKKKFNGYEVWILSANKDAMKNIGLRTSKKITLLNGQLECKYHRFKIFEGSRNH